MDEAKRRIALFGTQRYRCRNQGVSMRLVPARFTLSCILMFANGCLIMSQEEYKELLAYATDADLDGYAPRDGDCDDQNNTIHPGAADDWYDGVDTNCDGRDDFDADEDGSPTPDDCDDTDPLAAPGLSEECDGVDEDCDGVVDEGLSAWWYRDVDGDGQGDPESAIYTCLPPSGFISDDSDCNDNDESVFTDAPELCGDGVINDCAGQGGECGPRGEHELGTTASAPVALVLFGDGVSDLAGQAVAMGDFTGRGQMDIVVSAPSADSGVVYVLAAPHPVGESAPSEEANETYIGGSSGYSTGWKVNVPGDLDGDGRDDLLVVAGEHSSIADGAIHLLTPDQGGETDLYTHNRALLTYAGFYDGDLAGLGDIDDDGDLDFAVGHSWEDDARGAVFIWDAFTGTPLLQDAPVQVVGADTGDHLGSSVSGADLNGDGVPEMVVSATNASSESGCFYVLAGPLSATVNLTDAEASVCGATHGDHLGSSLQAGSDLNGDGLMDLVVGAPDGEDNGAQPGYVLGFHGAASLSESVASSAFAIHGQEDGDALGTSLLMSTDTNGDGIAELVVSAPGLDQEESAVGGVMVWYDVFLGVMVPDSADLVVHGAVGSDRIGSSLVGGDATGDGVDDLLIGSRHFHDTLGEATGAAHLLSGIGP